VTHGWVTAKPSRGSAIDNRFVVVRAGGLVLCLLLSSVLISFGQNELGDVSPQERMLQKTPFAA
jgi:hypothetical protein